jgi:hypothetical protein
MIRRDNASFPVPSAPSTSSVPPPHAVLANALITVSLTCSLLASFGAVLGKQWVLAYGQITAESPLEKQDQYQNWIDGGERWHLRDVVEGVIPLLLQGALVLFIAGLIIFFKLDSSTISTVNFWIAIGGLVAVVVLSCLAFCDPYSPYHTPITKTILPRLFKWICAALWIGVMLIIFPIPIVVSFIWHQISWLLKTLKIIQPGDESNLTRIERDPSLNSIFTGNNFRWWQGTVEAAMTWMQRSSPSKSANCGYTIAWILSNYPDDDKALQSVVSSLAMTDDDEFLDAFCNRGVASQAGLRWELAMRQMDAVFTSDSTIRPPKGDSEKLELNIELYEAIILHVYGSTKLHIRDEQESCVRRILRRKKQAKERREKAPKDTPKDTPIPNGETQDGNITNRIAVQDTQRCKCCSETAFGATPISKIDMEGEVQRIVLWNRAHETLEIRPFLTTSEIGAIFKYHLRKSPSKVETFREICDRASTETKPDVSQTVLYAFAAAKLPQWCRAGKTYDWTGDIEALRNVYGR